MRYTPLLTRDGLHVVANLARHGMPEFNPEAITALVDNVMDPMVLINMYGLWWFWHDDTMASIELRASCVLIAVTIQTKTELTQT